MIFKNFKILHFPFCILHFSFFVLYFSLFTFHFSLSLSYAEGENQKPEIKPYKQLYNNGYVNWTDGIVVAKGIAPYPEKKDLASARALSKLAAKKVCQRNLLSTVLEINVDDEQKIENLIKTNKQVKINVEGIVKGAVVITEEGDDNAKISSVVMQSPLWGIGGIITVFLKDKRKVLENKREMGKIEKFDFEKFEGLVVDTRDFELDPALFPEIVDEDGNVIYDKNLPDVKDLYRKGMVRYITTTQKDFEYLKGKKHFKKETYNSQITKFFSNLKAYAEETKKYFVKALNSTGKLSANLILENRIALKVNKLKITDKYLRHCDVVVIVGSGVRGEKTPQDRIVLK